MIKKTILTVTIIIIVLTVIYMLMLFDTKNIKKQVEDAFYGNVDPNEIESSPLSRYYTYKIAKHPNATVSLKLKTVFTFHNFMEGVVWFKYDYELRDENGKLLAGAWDIVAKMNIKKYKGKWEVVKVYEAP